MLFNKKNTGLLLAGVAAYAAYRFSKMSKSERKDMTDRVKAKGQKIYDEYVPGNVKNWFEKNKNTGNANAEPPLYTF
jgi:hypothetical protein